MGNHRKPLVEAIDAFLKRHGMSPVTFGRRALKDPHFVAQLKAGRRCWPETEAKVRSFMATYKPDQAAA